MRFPRILLLPVAGILAASPAGAQVDLHGFVEGAWGLRTAQSPVHDDSR